MKTRRLGKTELQVSEIGFGGEWLERHPEEESIELIHYASAQGINILDCWMPDPKSRNIIGEGIRENRDKWFIQGHIGSTWKDEQYYRTREMEYVRPAFEDLLKRLQTDYIDLGMIHYVDSEEEWENLQHSEYMDYVMELKRTGVIRHIGMSSHNPKVAKKAAESGYVEMILFSINPAFDMLPASENIDTMFAEEFDSSLIGIDADRARLYIACEENDVGITVMKGFAGGRLFDEKRSPFGVSLTPVQCIHYALTRPAVCSIMCGYDTKEQVNDAVAYSELICLRLRVYSPPCVLPLAIAWKSGITNSPDDSLYHVELRYIILPPTVPTIPNRSQLPLAVNKKSELISVIFSKLAIMLPLFSQFR